MLPTSSSAPSAATVNFHGKCQKCHHWHNKVPLTIADPTHFSNVGCCKCGGTLFALGGNSTHASLASQETIAQECIPRTDTFKSDDIPERIVPELQLGGSLVQLEATRPTLWISAETPDTQMTDDENLGLSPDGRNKNQHLSPQSPSPSLLSPTRLSPVNRERSRSAPPQPSLESPKQEPNLRRGSSFKVIKAEVKRVLRKRVNRWGYDVVRINSPSRRSPALSPRITAEDLSASTTTPPIPPLAPLGTLVHPSEIPVPPSRDTIIQQSDIQMPVHPHQSSYPALSDEEIKRIRGSKTLQAMRNAACSCERVCICGQRSSESARPLSSTGEAHSPSRSSTNPQYDTVSSSNNTSGARSTEETPRSGIESGNRAVREFGRYRARLPQPVQSSESLDSRAMPSELLSASNRNSDRMSTATTVLDPLESETSGSLSAPPSTTDLLPQISPHVPLRYPYPPRISTDLSNASDNSERRLSDPSSEHDGDDDQDEGGLTPIAAGGRRSSIIFDPPTREDIHNDEHWQSRNNNRESRASVDAASVTSTRGSASYQDGEE